MPNNEVFRINDFSGGLNEIGNQVEIGDNQTPSCQNCVFDEMGALVKRKGYKSILDTEIDADKIDGIYLFHKKDGARYMIVAAEGSLYEVDESDGTTSILEYDGGGDVDDLNDTSEVSFTTWGNTCYISTGHDDLLEFDGDVVKTNSDAPRGTLITNHQNIIFISGNKNNPSELYYSELGTGDFSDYSTIKVSTDDGDHINNIIKQQNNLVIFKTNSIHALYGSSEFNFELREVQPNVGTISPRSVVNIMNRLFFLYRDGVYVFDGTSIKMVSEMITPSIKKIVNPQETAAAWDSQRYYLAYSDRSGEENSKVLVYNLLHESWTRFTNVPAAMFNNYDGSQDGSVNMGELYFGSSKSGQIYEMGEGKSDDGDDIDLRYKTKYFNFQSPETVKTFRNIWVDILLMSGEMDVVCNIDRRQSRSFTFSGDVYGDENLWGADWGDLIWYEHKQSNLGSPFRGNSFGRTVQFNIKEKSDENFKFYGLSLNMRPRRKRFRG
ncbi:MAG: hypothetical protein ACOC2J_04685 [bacterium]